MRASTRDGPAACPGCGTAPARVHSRYERTLGDAGVGGRPLTILLQVRRLFCDSTECGRVTFVEQVEGLTTRHARRSVLLRRMLEAIGLALAGRAGARLAGHLGIAANRSTILRLVRALPDPQVGTVSTLGVDDFALRRGHVYGTVVLNMQTHRPIDLLADRQAETFANWLREHPGTEVICRDRGGAYAEGARQGAPDAIQVADRWHLWHNLGEHVEKTVLRHRADLPEPIGDGPPDDDPNPTPDVAPPTAAIGEKTIVTRTKLRYAAVQELYSRGVSLSSIARTLDLDVATVRRFAHATGLDELLIKTLQRASLLDEFKAYLHQRWTQGCTDAARLAEEITVQGYRGSEQTVRRYLHEFRTGRPAPKPHPAAPTVRDVTGWIMRRPDRLDQEEQLKFKQVRARSRHLDATAAHVAAFAEMLTGLHGERLETWITAVEADDLPHLHSFTSGLRRDHAAVYNGLTTSHNSGMVEGTVNKIKFLKRQMYGRANLDLLRKRVLLAA
ncbi:MAG: ISL3 family transposase [Pseudonocardiales bacterium]|nr:MAG: ISL3 family transposase [Pseudonocardiales bacterium]